MVVTGCGVGVLGRVCVRGCGWASEIWTHGLTQFGQKVNCVSLEKHPSTGASALCHVHVYKHAVTKICFACQLYCLPVITCNMVCS